MTPARSPAVIETAAGGIMVDEHTPDVSLRLVLTYGPAHASPTRSVMLELEPWQAYRLARMLRERALGLNGYRPELPK